MTTHMMVDRQGDALQVGDRVRVHLSGRDAEATVTRLGDNGFVYVQDPKLWENDPGGMCPENLTILENAMDVGL